MVMLLVDDTKGQVQRVAWQPGGDFFRPFDGEAVRADEKVFQHQRVDLQIIFQPVSVEMNEGACAATMQGENVEGRTRDGVGHAEAFGQALHESGFSHAEIAVERERGVGRQRLREAKRDSLGFLS